MADPLAFVLESSLEHNFMPGARSATFSPVEVSVTPGDTGTAGPARGPSPRGATASCSRPHLTRPRSQPAEHPEELPHLVRVEAGERPPDPRRPGRGRG